MPTSSHVYQSHPINSLTAKGILSHYMFLDRQSQSGHHSAMGTQYTHFRHFENSQFHPDKFYRMNADNGGASDWSIVGSRFCIPMFFLLFLENLPFNSLIYLSIKLHTDRQTDKQTDSQPDRQT